MCPYNISAVSGASIEARQVADAPELMRSIPGVAVVDRGYRNSGVITGINIRGLNVDSSALGDYAVSTVPTVSSYVNDTPIYANFLLRDLERVEVLRGPQGTLYGSGSLGGTIRYITARAAAQQIRRQRAAQRLAGGRIWRHRLQRRWHDQHPDGRDGGIASQREPARLSRASPTIRMCTCSMRTARRWPSTTLALPMRSTAG